MRTSLGCCKRPSFSDLSDLPGVYGTISSSKYVGALSCNDLKTLSKSLKCDLFLTGSQCSCIRDGVIELNFFLRVIILVVSSNPAHGEVYSCCEFESCSWRDVLNTTLCDKVCQ